MSEDQIVTRDATDADLNYVLSTWVRSYGSTISSGRRQVAIAEFRRRYVDRIMRDRPRVVVLCSPESPTTLHGYAVDHQGVLAWVYVVKDLRGMGLARKAISAALGSYPDAIRAHYVPPTHGARFRLEKLPDKAA